MNKEPSHNSMDNSYLYEIMTTIREMRDISKEHLIAEKKLVKLLEDKNQISFLYDREDKSEKKQPKLKKQ